MKWTVTTSIIVGGAVMVFIAALGVQYWARPCPHTGPLFCGFANCSRSCQDDPRQPPPLAPWPKPVEGK
jgi:hypothetical protein